VVEKLKNREQLTKSQKLQLQKPKILKLLLSNALRVINKFKDKLLVVYPFFYSWISSGSRQAENIADTLIFSIFCQAELISTVPFLLRNYQLGLMVFCQAEFISASTFISRNYQL
jgi:hypothetical protein